MREPRNLWKTFAIIQLIVIGLFSLSLYQNRAKYDYDPDSAVSPVFSAIDDVIQVDGKSYVVIFATGVFPAVYDTAKSVHSDEELIVTFGERDSVFPKIAWMESVSTRNYRGYPSWDNVFAFEVTPEIERVVDANSKAVLWSRPSSTQED